MATITMFVGTDGIKLVPLTNFEIEMFDTIRVYVLLTVDNANKPSISFDSRGFEWITTSKLHKVETPCRTICDYIYTSYMLCWPVVRCHSVLKHVYRKAMEHLDGIVGSPGFESGDRVEDIQALKRYITCDPSKTLLPRTWQKLDELMEKEALARLQHRKTRCIQTKWRDVISNPFHPICQRRLLFEFDHIDAY